MVAEHDRVPGAWAIYFAALVFGRWRCPSGGARVHAIIGTNGGLAMSNTFEIQTTDSTRFVHSLNEVIAAASQPENQEQGENELTLTAGETHWSADVRVRLRLADPARQEAKRRR